MTQEEIDKAVKEMGVQRALHVADMLEKMMPTLLRTRAGQRTASFIQALRLAAQRAQEDGPVGA